jgi:hypothetical protein
VSDELDHLVLDYMTTERAAGRAVSNQQLKDQARELATDLPNMAAFKACPGWMKRWKKRNNIRMRRGTNDSQKLPEGYAEQISAFRDELADIRDVNAITDYNLANMDQTMVRFDMPQSRTNNVAGENDIRIATTGGARRSFTVALTATGNGQKLKAFIVMRDRNGVIPARALAQLRIPPNVYVRASENGWMNSHLMAVWTREVWGPSDDDVRRLLILDSAQIHTAQQTREWLEGN